jgi:hypothetical protein
MKHWSGSAWYVSRVCKLNFSNKLSIPRWYYFEKSNVVNACKFSLYVLKVVGVPFKRGILKFRSDQSEMQHQYAVYGGKNVIV